MGKIVFTKREDGCLVASDKELYQASMISEPDFDLAVDIVNAAKDKSLTAFRVLEKNRPQNILYAVDNKTKEITKALIVKLSDGSVKFIFDNDTALGTRVYVQDGDMMFSTKEEALEEIDGVVRNHEEQTSEDAEGSLRSIMNKFLNSIKEAKRRQVTEEHKDDESVINEHIEHHESTEEEKVEAAKASLELSVSMQLAKLAARRIMLLDMVNDIDREIAALNAFSKMHDEGNIQILGGMDDDDED